MPKLKTLEYAVSFIDQEGTIQEMWALVPQIHFKKVQSVGFFYAKGRKNRRDCFGKKLKPQTEFL